MTISSNQTENGLSEGMHGSFNVDLNIPLEPIIHSEVRAREAPIGHEVMSQRLIPEYLQRLEAERYPLGQPYIHPSIDLNVPFNPLSDLNVEEFNTSYPPTQPRAMDVRLDQLIPSYGGRPLTFKRNPFEGRGFEQLSEDRIVTIPAGLNNANRSRTSTQYVERSLRTVPGRSNPGHQQRLEEESFVPLGPPIDLNVSYNPSSYLNVEESNISYPPSQPHALGVGFVQQNVHDDNFWDMLPVSEIGSSSSSSVIPGERAISIIQEDPNSAVNIENRRNSVDLLDSPPYAVIYYNSPSSDPGLENAAFNEIPPSLRLQAIIMRAEHRSLGFDVDNMTYEDLLNMEERIGSVTTGLREATISMYLKQRKFKSAKIGAPSEVDLCCFCQEEYTEGAYLGILDCGHEFHTSCIKQWLKQKNRCPFCNCKGLELTCMRKKIPI